MSWDRIGGGYAWAGIEWVKVCMGWDRIGCRVCMGWDRIGGRYAWAGIE